MATLNRLLVIIEPGQDEQPALDKALLIAQQGDAELELVICDHSPYLDDGRFFDPPRAAELRSEHIEGHRRRLEEIAGVVREQGFHVRVDALWGHPPYETIIDKVLESEPDLLLQTTQPHERIARLFLRHQDWQLLRYCPCPLLLVREHPWHEEPVFVASVDPAHVHDESGELDDRLVRAGRKLAEHCSGRLYLFHSCYQPPVSGIYPVSVDPRDCRGEATELLERHGLPEEALHASDEEISRSLPAMLGEVSADVVIMGGISRSRLERLLVGNTAERVLDRLEQDVLVIKPEGFTDTVKRARQASHAL